MNTRIPKQIAITLASGGKGQTEALSEAIPLGPLGLVTVQSVIDNGTDNAAPSDAPIGSLRLYSSAMPGAPYSLVDTANADLDAISPIGNTAVNKTKSFESTPGYSIKLVYAYTSGGAGTGRARIYVTVS